MCNLLVGCAATSVKSKYASLGQKVEKNHKEELGAIANLKASVVNPDEVDSYKVLENKIAECKSDKSCQKDANGSFILFLKEKYYKADFTQVFLLCNGVCKSSRQFEALVAISHRNNAFAEATQREKAAEETYKNIVDELSNKFKEEYAQAKLKDSQTWAAVGAGLQAFSEGMQQASQQSQSYNNTYSNTTSNYNNSNYNTYSQPAYSNSSAFNRFSPSSPANRFGHGMSLYDSKGNYRGQWSANQFDPNSTSNKFGKYGSKFSPDSINNRFGAGSPFSNDSPNNPHGQGLKIIDNGIYRGQLTNNPYQPNSITNPFSPYHPW